MKVMLKPNNLKRNKLICKGASDWIKSVVFPEMSINEHIKLISQK